MITCFHAPFQAFPPDRAGTADPYRFIPCLLIPVRREPQFGVMTEAGSLTAPLLAGQRLQQLQGRG